VRLKRRVAFGNGNVMIFECNLKSSYVDVLTTLQKKKCRLESFLKFASRLA
jgi:hypothetical protein